MNIIILDEKFYAIHVAQAVHIHPQCFFDVELALDIYPHSTLAHGVASPTYAQSGKTLFAATVCNPWGMALPEQNTVRSQFGYSSKLIITH